MTFRAYIIKDPHDNIYLETIGLTKEKTISAFLEKVKLPVGKNLWANYKKAGYVCAPLTITVNKRNNTFKSERT